MKQSMIGMLLFSMVLLITACFWNKPSSMNVSYDKQVQMCHQIKRAMGDLQLRTVPNEGGQMPTTQARLIDEYTRYHCDQVANKI